MNTYLITYQDYDDIVETFGHGIPYTNLEHVKTVLVELSETEAQSLTEAGFDITLSHNDYELLYTPPPITPVGVPPPINAEWNLDISHTSGFDGTGVKVAVIDSGCTDQAAAAIANITRLDYTGSGIHGDDAFHGSVGCLCIGQTNDYYSPFALENWGIAYGADVYSMRVIGTVGPGIIAAMVLALNDCIALGIDIINISLSVGGGLNTQLQACLDAGIIVVCASGNSLASQMAYPAIYGQCLAISGIDATTAVLFGSYLTPGNVVKVDAVSFTAGCAQFAVGGTSQGAFQTSAMLAVYKQKYPWLDNASARNLLRRRARKMDGYVYNVSSVTFDTLVNYETGAGFINTLN